MQQNREFTKPQYKSIADSRAETQKMFCYLAIAFAMLEYYEVPYGRVVVVLATLAILGLYQANKNALRANLAKSLQENNLEQAKDLVNLIGNFMDSESATKYMTIMQTNFRAAVEKNDLPTARELLKAIGTEHIDNTDLNKIFSLAKTKFRNAARDGDLAQVKDLLSFIGNPNIDSESSNGMTALSWAARYKKNVEVVKFLVSKGADVNHIDKEWNTPVHEAVNFEKQKQIEFKTLLAMILPPPFSGMFNNKPKFDPTIKNKQNETVFTLFEKIKNCESSADYQKASACLSKAMRQKSNSNTELFEDNNHNANL